MVGRCRKNSARRPHVTASACLATTTFMASHPPSLIHPSPTTRTFHPDPHSSHCPHDPNTSKAGMHRLQAVQRPAPHAPSSRNRTGRPVSVAGPPAGDVRGRHHVAVPGGIHMGDRDLGPPAGGRTRARFEGGDSCSAAACLLLRSRWIISLGSGSTCRPILRGVHLCRCAGGWGSTKRSSLRLLVLLRPPHVHASAHCFLLPWWLALPVIGDDTAED